MYQTREIVYDYKIRVDWGKEQQRSRRLRWALAMAAPIAVALLGGMASHQIRKHEFRLPPWGKLFEKTVPTADKVLLLPVSTESLALISALAPPPRADRPFMPQAVAAPAPMEPLEVSAEVPVTAPEETGSEHGDWQTITVRSGENLSIIFDRLGLSGNDLDRIVGLGGDASSLKHLDPEDNLRFRINDGTLAEMMHEIDLGHTLHVRNQDGAFTAETIAEELQTRTVHASGVIESSLFEAGLAAGLPDATIMSMADIFGYDIDLVLDIRDGDRFSIVYEEIYKDGSKVKDGNILAAEFVNQGKVYRAVRYASAQGVAEYYRPDGKALRRAFIRTPVAFTRITSKFSHQRRHPVLNTIRAHKGVDYAAPTGTPVRATGDATVSVAGWQGGYGRMVILEHKGGYTTVYGHLSKFAKGIKTGAMVRLGQTIGYVGQSGLATGPHLHYEFRVKGVHRDPLKVALPPSTPLVPENLADFRSKTQRAMALLDEASTLAAAPAAGAGNGTAADAAATEASGHTVVATAPH